MQPGNASENLNTLRDGTPRRPRSLLLDWVGRDHVARRTHLHGEFLSYLNVFHFIGVRERGKGKHRNQDGGNHPHKICPAAWKSS